MWIVRLALRRPYTFVVLALLLLFLGPIVILRTPVDIFPNIDIPVVSVAWAYAGLSPQQLSDRIVVQFERQMTTTVNDIEHTESQSLNGIGVVKIFFQPGVQVAAAVAASSPATICWTSTSDTFARASSTVKPAHQPTTGRPTAT